MFEAVLLLVWESAVAVVTLGEQLVSSASQSRQGETHPQSRTRLIVRSKKEKTAKKAEQ